MKRTLVLHDGRAGNLRQAQALAQRITPHPLDLALSPRAPWRWLAPRPMPLAARRFDPALSPWLLTPPAWAIGCGRQAALATRLLRARGSLAVQILDPRIDARHWDIVIVPAHDRLRGANVLTLQGSLHPVDDDYLLRAVSVFPELALLPEPHCVLLVGGPTRHAPLDTAGFTQLVGRLSAWAHAERGSFSAIASRRTPPAWRAVLGAVNPSLPGLRWRDTGDGTNPYAGLLAYADRLVVTPDSVNMLSEAAATHAPLFVWAPEAVSGRPRRFLDTLLANGRAHPLDDELAPFFAEPLRETARIATEVLARLG